MISGNDEIEQIADILDCMSDLTYCTVCACMQTQHQEQLKTRDPNARPPPPHNPMAPPPHMHMQQMPPQGRAPPQMMQPQYVQQAPPQMMQPQYAQQPAYGYPAQPQAYGQRY
jgi:hypothetical protein